MRKIDPQKPYKRLLALRDEVEKLEPRWLVLPHLHKVYNALLKQAQEVFYDNPKLQIILPARSDIQRDALAKRIDALLELMEFEIALSHETISMNADEQAITIIKRCPMNFAKCSRLDEIQKDYSEKKIFINIPYHADYKPFEDVIVKTMNEMSLIPVLAKEKFKSDIILCKVCMLIHTCKYGLADISYPSLNVPLELGLMFGLSKKSVILRYRQSEQPSDIQGKEARIYTTPHELRSELEGWIADNIAIG